MADITQSDAITRLVLRLRESGQVQPLFLATPTPTRNALTFVQEAEAHFSSGNLSGAIEAYRQAVAVDAENATVWALLARVLTYASDLETTYEGRRARLEEARQAIDRAVEIDDENAFAYAIRALTYDWSASSEIKEAITTGDTVRVLASIGDGGAIGVDLSAGRLAGRDPGWAAQWEQAGCSPMLHPVSNRHSPTGTIRQTHLGQTPKS